MLAVGMMDERQRQTFENHREVDFAYSLSGVGRFRVNVFRQRGSIGMTLRRVATERATMEELGLPPILERLADEPRGLILVTGTAGSGKTTTLAAMIDHINHTREGHIVTIEDPIEVLHQDVKCIVNQREIGIDTESYADALRHVVRQDPDVVLIGEMRDHETVSAALTAAEIGNLVLSTLHTIDATETINRIIDFFPPYQQKQVRLMMAATLKGIVSMRLIPSLQGGLVPAVEVLVMTGTVREYITDPGQDLHDPGRDGGGGVLRHADVRPVADHALREPADHPGRRDRDVAERPRLQDQGPRARHRPDLGGPDRRLLGSRRLRCRGAGRSRSTASAASTPTAAPVVSSSQSTGSGVRIGTNDWCHSSLIPYAEASAIASTAARAGGWSTRRAA